MNLVQSIMPCVGQVLVLHGVGAPPSAVLRLPTASVAPAASLCMPRWSESGAAVKPLPLLAPCKTLGQLQTSDLLMHLLQLFSS